MLELEYAPPRESERCECCGGKSISLTRYVLQDGDAFAVVYLRYSANHEDRIVSAMVSVGAWWDGTGPADRTAFALEFTSSPENYEVMVCDAETSPWQGVELIGRMLDREEALEHPLLKDVFHVTDHLFREDDALKAFLDAAPAAQQ